MAKTVYVHYQETWEEIVQALGIVVVAAIVLAIFIASGYTLIHMGEAPPAAVNHYYTCDSNANCVEVPPAYGQWYNITK